MNARACTGIIKSRMQTDEEVIAIEKK